jgi:hypothetical protein
MIVKTLKVIAEEFVCEINSEETKKTYGFLAYEYPNGVCTVSYEHTNDAFFLNRDAIEACGLDQVLEVQEIGEIWERDLDSFRETLDASIKEFGSDLATEKALELLN